jgi:hypothetical protein
MATADILLISLQGFSAVLLVALLVYNARQAARSREFEAAAATRNELSATAKKLADRLDELESRLAAKTDLAEATTGLAKRDDLSEAVEPLSRSADVERATADLARKDDVTRATESLARASDLRDALRDIPTSADFSALVDSLLVRQTNEVAHRLDTLSAELSALTHADAENGHDSELRESLTQKSIEAALELFDAAEELVTVTSVPLEDLPRDGGASIRKHQARALDAVARVRTAGRGVDMLYPPSNPICTAAKGVTDAAETVRESMRANQEMMERAALNGAAQGTTSAQRLAYRNAEQRARDAQANYADALGPVRERLGGAFEVLSDALNTEIHGTRRVES